MSVVPFPPMKRPLVAILRGVRPEEAEGIVSVLIDSGMTAISMERKGSGELSGISIAVMPFSISALTISAVSSGFTPRRIAISGRFIGGNGTTLIRLILYTFHIDSAAIESPRRTASSAPIDLTGTETVSNANW